jgi:DNA replication licensing factor MCM2
VNLAIRVMLESFISAQKFAVMKTLRAQFARYLTIGADYNQLLLLKLRQLVKERQALEFVRAGSRGAAALAGAGMERVEITSRDLLERAKAHGITDLGAFLTSDALRNAGFAYDAGRHIIVRDFY